MNSHCPCCDSSTTSVHVAHPQDREYFVKRTVAARYLRCLNCRSVFQNPWPTAKETGQFYHADYQNYAASRSPLLAGLSAWLQRRTARSFLRDIPRTAAILDFGCNQGAFLNSLHESGCTDLTGFDVVPLKTSTEKFKFYSDLTQLLANPKRYDVIRMNHVIEHLPELESDMKMVGRLLKEGGRVIGQTPNAGHYTCDLMKSYWGALHYPYHLALFSPEGLAIASKRWGLRLISVKPTIMPTGWAMSLENWMKAKTFPGITGRTPVYVLYLMVTAPFVVFDWVFSWKSKTAIVDFGLVKESLDEVNHSGSVF